MEITRQPDGSADVTARYVSEREGDEQETTQHFDKLPAILNLPVGVVTLADNTLPKDTLAKAPEIKEALAVEATIQSPVSVAAGYKARLSAEPTSKTTSIVALCLSWTDGNGCESQTLPASQRDWSGRTLFSQKECSHADPPPGTTMDICISVTSLSVTSYFQCYIHI